MKIHFLPSALDDLEWMKEYYEAVFPAGKPNAGKNFNATLALLRDNPNVGIVVDSVPTTHRFPIMKTPFSLVYRIQGDEIQVVRVADQRSAKP